ncbi:unnamed protein product, partial [Closterium sp. NIES-54]
MTPSVLLSPAIHPSGGFPVAPDRAPCLDQINSSITRNLLPSMHLHTHQVDSQSLQIERLFAENSGLAAGLKEVSAIAARWEAQVGTTEAQLSAAKIQVRTWQQLQSEQQQQMDSSKGAATAGGASTAAGTGARAAFSAEKPGGTGEVSGGEKGGAGGGAEAAAAAGAMGPGLGDTDTEADTDDPELPVSTSPRQHLELPPVNTSPRQLLEVPPFSGAGTSASGEENGEVVVGLQGDGVKMEGSGAVEGGGEERAGKEDGEKEEVRDGARGGEDGGVGQRRGASVDMIGGKSMEVLEEENRKLKDDLTAAQNRIRQLSVQALRSDASCTTAVQRLSQTKR